MANWYFVESQDYENVRGLVEDENISVAIVHGGPGIGKTRLARQIMDDVVDLRDGWKTYTFHTRTRDMYQMSREAIVISETFHGHKYFTKNSKPDIFELAEKLSSEKNRVLVHLDELQLEDETVDMYWPKLTRMELDRESPLFDTKWLNDVIQEIRKCAARKETKVKLLLTLRKIPEIKELNELCDLDPVKCYKMKGFSPENTKEFIRSYTTSKIVLNKSEAINDACKGVPLQLRAMGNAFSAMNDPEEVDEYLNQVKQRERPNSRDSKSRPSMIILQSMRQLTIWKIVRQLGRTLIPKDFILAIIMEYKSYCTDSTKPEDRLVAELQSTDVFALMRVDFINNELMAESREGNLREQIYLTIHETTWHQLHELTEEDSKELQLVYKRVALRAIAAVIEFDDRFHVYNKETPGKLSYSENHIKALFQNLKENLEQLYELTGFERLLYYRLLFGIYYPKRKHNKATKTDIEELRGYIEKFEQEIKSGRLKFDKESIKLCEMWLKRQRFTDRDKDLFIRCLEPVDVKVRVDPRRHLKSDQPDINLLEELRKAKLLISEQLYHKVICHETQAVMYILLSKMEGNMRPSVGSRLNAIQDKDLNKAREIFKDLMKKNKILFLQYNILERDRIVLELPENDGEITVELCDDLIRRYKELQTNPSMESKVTEFAYEFGFARSEPSKDNFHKLVCHEKILVIYGKKAHALRDGRDDEDQLSKCYQAAHKIFGEIKTYIKEEEEKNRPRAYAYSLRNVATFLSNVGEVKLALRYYSFALTRLQKYSIVMQDLPMSNEVEMPTYEKICQSIQKLSKPLARGAKQQDGVKIFEECFCINPVNPCECEPGYMLKNYIGPMLEEMKDDGKVHKALKLLSATFSTTAAESE